MSIQLKNGVGFVETHPAIRYALEVVNRESKEKFRPVLTSAQDSDHGKDSLHYGIPGDPRCRAVDIRKRNIPALFLDTFLANIKRYLGPGFDVILESDHIHIEYDP